MTDLFQGSPSVAARLSGVLLGIDNLGGWTPSSPISST
jgi:hypothetical protein